MMMMVMVMVMMMMMMMMMMMVMMMVAIFLMLLITYTQTSSTTKHIPIYHRPSQNSQGAITFATLPVSGNVLLCTCNGGIHLCNRPRSRRIKIGKNAYLYFIHIVYIYSVYIYILPVYIYLHTFPCFPLSLSRHVFIC